MSLRVKPSFPFCKGCPADDNCCTGKTEDLPVLTPKDISAISRKTGLSASDFSIPTTNGLSNIRSRRGRCYFYKNGACTIYAVRPLDCKLFPFDVYLNDEGKPVLVLYLTACPAAAHAEAFVKRAQSFVKQGHPHLEEFAAYRPPRFDQHPYKVIETIT